MHWSRKFD